MRMLVELEKQIGVLTDGFKGQEKLLVSYRLGARPPESAFTAINKAKKLINEQGGGRKQ